MRIPAILILISLSLSTCTKEDGLSPSLPVTTIDVDLDNPTIGQISLYEFSFADCSGDETAYALNGDTLQLSVTESMSSIAIHHVMFKESYTEGSVSYVPGEEVTYPVLDKGDHLLIPQRADSRLFFFYDNDTLWKNPDPDIDLHRSGCILETPLNEPFIGNDIGYLANYDIDIAQKANVTVVSCEPFFSLDAYLLYDEDHLEVSHVAEFGGFIPQSHAWTRIE